MLRATLEEQSDMGLRCLTKRLLKHSADDISRRLLVIDGVRTRFGEQGITYIPEDLKGSSIILYREELMTKNPEHGDKNIPRSVRKWGNSNDGSKM